MLDTSVLHFILSILTKSPVSPNTSNPNNPTTLKVFPDSELSKLFQVEITIIDNDCWHKTDPVVWFRVCMLESKESDVLMIIGCAHVNGLII